MGCLRLNLFSYDRLDDWWLLTQSWLWGPNYQDTTTRLHILARNVRDTVNSISIGSTGKPNLQPQIQIELDRVRID